MPRIRFPEVADLPPEHQDLFDDIQRKRGRVSDLFRALAHSPEVLRCRMAYGESLRKKTILRPRLRELAILTVTLSNGGGYEFKAHGKHALEAGISPEQIAQVGEYRTSPLFDAQDRSVMAYAQEVTERVAVADATWQAIAAFLNERELVELVLNVAWYNQTSRVTAPLGIGE